MAIVVGVINSKGRLVHGHSGSCFSGLPGALVQVVNDRGMSGYKCVRQYLHHKALSSDLKKREANAYLTGFGYANDDKVFMLACQSEQDVQTTFEMFEMMGFDTLIEKYNREKIISQGYFDWKRDIPMQVLVGVGSYFRFYSDYPHAPKTYRKLIKDELPKLEKAVGPRAYSQHKDHYDRAFKRFFSVLATYLSSDGNAKNEYKIHSVGCHSPFGQNLVKGEKAFKRLNQWRSNMDNLPTIVELLKRKVRGVSYRGRNFFFSGVDDSYGFSTASSPKLKAIGIVENAENSYATTKFKFMESYRDSDLAPFLELAR
jgi:hypothetical protein